MKNFGFGILALLSNLSLALAQTVYPIPSLPSAKVSVAIVKSVKDETRVIGNGFKLTIPKGWTLNPVGESDRFAASFNAHPTDDIANDPVYFGIHRRKTAFDLTKIKAGQLAQGRSVVEVNQKDYQALHIEYLDRKTNGRSERVFVRYVKSGANFFLILAGAPEGDAKIAALQSIVSSVSFQ